jgi:hypothetical protein
MSTIYPYGCQRSCVYEEGVADGVILTLMAISLLISIYSLIQDSIGYRKPKA